ncbi:MAG: ABC transporter ATP-binding protein [Ilumatobacteraceae bacterium]
MTAALHLDGVSAGYGGVPAVRGLDVELQPGEVLAVLGANGAGKTTTLLAIVGAIKLLAGSAHAFGNDLGRLRVEQIARLGVGIVPANRGLFPGLTVAEHFRIAARRREDGPAVDAALQRFPRLRELMSRRCGLLSGGEQQMLALAKALVGRPRLLMIDEMSLGLAPMIVQALLPTVRSLADDGMAVVLVEQHIDLALGVADQGIVLNHGHVALSGRAAALRASRDDVELAYFGSAKS